jgi:hypothetical protein
MKKKPVIKIILIAFVAVIAVFCVVAAMQPEDFKVQRSAKMSAAPQDVFAQVNDFHNWEAWSPWAKLDPNMKATHEGAASGRGAVYSWAGNSEVGEGKMTIVESQPGELVTINLEFIKPFAGTSTATFDFKGEGDQTSVTWSMEGKKNFIMKAMGLVINCDKMMGGQFEQGLEQMKSVVEKDKKST